MELVVDADEGVVRLVSCVGDAVVGRDLGCGACVCACACECEEEVKERADCERSQAGAVDLHHALVERSLII